MDLSSLIQALAGLGGGVTWVYKNANYNMSRGDGILANTEAGAITLYLPSSPGVGDMVAFVDITGSFATNNLTVNRNGSKIEGEEDNLVGDVNWMGLYLVYAGSDRGWVFFPFADASAGASMTRGQIDGLLLANNTGDANNDIDIAPGLCRDSTNQADLVLDASITKRLDAAWSQGSGNGGLDTGAKANSTWYHQWLIKKSTTNEVDALFSTSVSTPTMPSGWDIKRRIGSVRTNASGNILGFYQYPGGYFRWKAAVSDLNTTNPGTSAQTVTLTVPTGVRVRALFQFGAWSSTAAIAAQVSNLDVNDESPAWAGTPIGDSNGDTTTDQRKRMQEWTNTSAQIRYRLATSDAATAVKISTLGWLDPRGRDA